MKRFQNEQCIRGIFKKAKRSDQILVAGIPISMNPVQEQVEIDQESQSNVLLHPEPSVHSKSLDQNCV